MHFGFHGSLWPKGKGQMHNRNTAVKPSRNQTHVKVHQGKLDGRLNCNCRTCCGRRLRFPRTDEAYDRNGKCTHSGRGDSHRLMKTGCLPFHLSALPLHLSKLTRGCRPVHSSQLRFYLSILVNGRDDRRSGRIATDVGGGFNRCIRGRPELERDAHRLERRERRLGRREHRLLYVRFALRDGRGNESLWPERLVSHTVVHTKHYFFTNE